MNTIKIDWLILINICLYWFYIANLLNVNNKQDNVII